MTTQLRLCALCLDTMARPSNRVRAAELDSHGGHVELDALQWWDAVKRVRAGQLVSLNGRVTDAQAVTSVQGTDLCAYCVCLALDTTLRRAES